MTLSQKASSYIRDWKKCEEMIPPLQAKVDLWKKDRRTCFLLLVRECTTELPLVKVRTQDGITKQMHRFPEPFNKNFYDPEENRFYRQFYPETKDGFIGGMRMSNEEIEKELNTSAFIEVLRQPIITKKTTRQ